ncbi:hypothetical protein IFM53868_10383 [Aspergillus udagawae]|uniref:Uncharacterized protein n=1 Tax=Aspergillus udagawae TaxID=91492 RepID=A0ABQ1BE09_9EURO|nr:hypothetical protein IFM53868_10383 [Aspergillus udagawae]
MSAFERGFDEGEKGAYKFQDTSEGTLAPELLKLAFEKVAARFSDLEAPDSLDRQLAVVAALRLSFRKLSTQDPLLDWMAQYAAYCVGKRRLQTGFHELLRESPTLSSQRYISRATCRVSGPDMAAQRSAHSPINDPHDSPVSSQFATKSKTP